MRRLVLLAWLLLGLAARLSAQTAPTLVGSAKGETGGATTVTTSTSITATGVNRYLACGVATDSFGTNPTVTIMTFAGVNMNFETASDYVSGGSIGARVEFWGLPLEAAVSGSPTSTITATLDGSAAAAIACLLYTYVDQTTPHGTLATAGDRTPLPTVTVTSATGQTVIDFVGVHCETTNEESGLGTSGGQTILLQQMSSGSQPPYVFSSGEAGASSVVMDWYHWSYDSADVATRSWASIGVPLIFSSSGVTPSALRSFLLLGVGGDS